MANLDRRHALGLAALATAGPVLVACGEEGSTGSGAPATSAPAQSGGATGSTGGNAMVATADVPVGGGVIIGEQEVVVTQPSEGEFKAFSNICTHQSCPVSKVADGTIDCTCHFSKYSIEDGSVVEGPAPEPLPEKQITVSGDSITLG